MRASTALLMIVLASCNPTMDATVDPNNPDTMKPSDKPPIKLVPSGFDNKNGSRLKFGYTVTRSADGLAVGRSAIIMDTKLGVMCNELLAADGRKRCVPVTKATLLPNFYTDSSCTTPVFYSASACTGQEGNYGYAINNGIMPGCSAYEIHELGNQIQPAALYTKDGSMMCRATRPGEVNYNFPLYSSKRRMDSTEFVEVSVETVME